MKSLGPLFTVCRLFVLLLGLSSAVTVAAAEVGALGYITPRDKVLELRGQPGIGVSEIHVTPGQAVHAGDLLMLFSNAVELSANRELAAIELEQIKSIGPRRTALQRVVVDAASKRLARLEAQLDNYRGLSAGARSATELSRREQEVEEARFSEQREKLLLEQLEKEHAINLRKAAEQLRLADARLAQSRLVAPRDGVILEVRSQVGETLGSEPAILLADTSAMYVDCDVHESDLLKVKPGMRAIVSSPSLPQQLQGVVEQVSQTVNAANRLGKVLVKLDSSPWAEQLIGMEVNVAIHR